MSTLRIVVGIKSRSLLTQRLPVVLQTATSCLSSATNTKLYNHKQTPLPIFSILCLQNNNTFALKPGHWSTYRPRNYSTASSSNPNINEDQEQRGIQVYEGRVKSLMKKVKIFSLTTSFIGLVGQPYLWYSVQDMSLLLAAPMFTAINFFVFANPLMIHYLAKRYVTELYYNPSNETYTGVVLSLLARRQTFSFTAKDVQIPEIPGLFSMLTVKGRPIFIHHEDFTSIEIYKKMMGFDKPLDLTYVSDNAEKKEH